MLFLLLLVCAWISTHVDSFNSFALDCWMHKGSSRYRLSPSLMAKRPPPFSKDKPSGKLESPKRKRVDSPARRKTDSDSKDKTWKPLSTRWRLYNIEVLLENDPGKDFVHSHAGLTAAVAKFLRITDENFPEAIVEMNKENSPMIKIVRKAFDGRWKKFGQPQFVYTVDVDLPLEICQKIKIRTQEGRLEPILKSDENEDSSPSNFIETVGSLPLRKNSKVVIIGAGPAGLFAAVALAEAGYKPIILERGQPVEVRGRDIGALFNRKILDPESNLCYGEGGAGTWSDGKLTTRIGKNSDDVRTILETLVQHGAPERILVDGKPHLGTDRLVRILKSLRDGLSEKGVEFRFGCTVEDFVLDNPSGAVLGATGYAVTPVGQLKALKLVGGGVIQADVAVLAVGHSARLVYDRLVEKGVSVEPKPIAVGFRVEHPQELINKIQYGEFGEQCERGKGKVPVADYRLTHEVSGPEVSNDNKVNGACSTEGARPCYSFCMCPGGQIVPTSVDESELCVNGMSFSKRQSQWANSALVVGVTPEDMVELAGSGPLRGVEWQRIMERRAAVMGGGKLVAPVQRVTDFLEGIIGGPGSPITSSYRMGVKEAPCHEIYPDYVTATLRESLLAFEKRMPGFITPDAILHGVETRTSAPVQITRRSDTLECVSLQGLYPAGEGAGYAGGIMSAAVDGMKVGRAIINALASQASPVTVAQAKQEDSGSSDKNGNGNSSGSDEAKPADNDEPAATKAKSAQKKTKSFFQRLSKSL